VVTGYVIPTGQTLESPPAPSYIIVGGQAGIWNTQGQYPALYKLGLAGDVTTLSLLTIGGEGTVWSGGYNGSTWLISGWGSGKYLNPYISFFNDTLTGKSRLTDYPQIGDEQHEWSGGDVFSVGWNGTAWLLTGMGSGVLYSYAHATNHMSMAVLSANGTFTDLSPSIPGQADEILYANAWNGDYWLVGGGWYGWGKGRLFILSGDRITDITGEIEAAVPTFNSIQSIAWNGEYFVIGGVGFLAEFYGAKFIDLTPLLDEALSPSDSLHANNSVNAISWTGESWMLAGGTPVDDYTGIGIHAAWMASYDPGSSASVPKASYFRDLTEAVLPSYVSQDDMNSTILTMSCLPGNGCAIGGADSSGGLLLWYDGGNSTDLSSTIYSAMSYVQWIGLPDN
jgi:hypothetical protein